MLNALLQTIANLGIDGLKINETFNAIIATIANGDMSSLAGLNNIMTGVISVVSGVSSTDVTTILHSLVNSVVDVLSNDTTSALLGAITGTK